MAEVLRDSLDEETGYGLAPYEIDPQYPTIEVDLKNKTVNNIPYEEFIELKWTKLPATTVKKNQR